MPTSLCAPWSCPKWGSRLLTLCSAAVLAAGCASYPYKTEDALGDFRRGHLREAMEAFGDTDVTDSAFLSGVEAGTVALAAGDWEAALFYFHQAGAISEEIEERALLGAERLGESLATWGLNDGAASYVGEGFERVYLHCGLAMAYLAKGLLDDVGVEVRLANSLLESEEELYEKEYRAGGLGHFLSALSYELRGELDQAFIDYERMMAKGVGEGIAKPALARLGQALGREEAVEAYGPPAEVPVDAASVVVVAGVGLGPYKVEGRLAVPTHDGIIAMALPTYQKRTQYVTELRLALTDTGEALRTDELENVAAIASENLEDRLVWTAAKTVARGVLKRGLTKGLESEYGIGGRVAGDLFAILTERADLRAWQTLPASWQACRLWVHPGVHAFELSAVGGSSLHLGRYELLPGETLFVLARSVDSQLYAHVIGGGPVDETGVTIPEVDLEALLGPEGEADSSPTQP